MRISDWSSDVCSSDLDTGTAGGKRSLACLGPRAIGKQPPAAAAIVSGMDLESPCHRIAKQPAALAFKHHAVEERARITVVQRKLPAPAALFGSLDARGLPRADRETYCYARLEASAVAEVELCRAPTLTSPPQYSPDPHAPNRRK